MKLSLSALTAKAALLKAQIDATHELLAQKRAEWLEVRECIKDFKSLQDECDLFPDVTDDMLHSLRCLSSELSAEINGIKSVIRELNVLHDKAWDDINTLEEKMGVC